MPAVPNGCDCFGCCSVQVPGGGTKDVRLGPECTPATINDPDKCMPCRKASNCNNDCARCELCIGKPTLPPDCNTGGTGGTAGTGGAGGRGGTGGTGGTGGAGGTGGTGTGGRGGAGGTTGSGGSSGSAGSGGSGGVCPVPICPTGVQSCGVPCLPACPVGNYCLTGCCVNPVPA